MPQPEDTDPSARQILIAGYRGMTPAQKVERVTALSRMVNELARSDIRRRYPEAKEREIELRLVSRWLPRDLMLRAFDWDVDETGY